MAAPGHAVSAAGTRLILAGWRLTIDFPHVLFVTAIAAWCGWYLLDARAASTDIQNLALIEPAAILVLAVYVFVLRDAVACQRVAVPEGADAPRREALGGALQIKIFGSMALLGLYVAVMGTIGFDLATFLYVVGNLLLLGERRLWILVPVPIVFVAIVVYCFSTILATPIPLLADRLR